MKQAIGLLLPICLICAGTSIAQTPVILISIDTLRGDVLGTHTPRILSYSDHGTQFTQAQSQIPLTLPSHTSLLTSTYPFETGVEENAGRVPQDLPTLAAVLRAQGYKTAAFIGSVFLERQVGLDRGFDTYDSPFDFEAFSRLSGEMIFAGRGGTAYSVRERRPGALVIRAANQWLKSHRGEPAFLFVHLFDMHKPWRQPTYTSQLEAVDQLLGEFLENLKREGWWDRSLVVLVSDHGEGLGDHGESDHGYFIYQSTLHVPLIIHWPTGKEAMPARVDRPVGLIDVAPTILDFLKIPAPASFKGRSLLNASPRDVFAESVYARDSFGWAALRSLRSGPWKYIDAPRPELYNLGQDPKELNNLVHANTAEASRLKLRLQKYRAATPQPAPPPPSAGTRDPNRNKQVLESLGYLAPGPRATLKGPLPDPKDRLPELLRYEDGLTLLQKHEVSAAAAVFRSIVTADPRNLLARRELGVALLEQKNFQEAAKELRQVVKAAPEDYITLYELGLATESAGDWKEALAHFEAALHSAPGASQAAQAVERVTHKLKEKP